MKGSDLLDRRKMLMSGAGAVLLGSVAATRKASAATLDEEVVFVGDFGAVGDGTTVDTTALQEAISHAYTQGLAVFWPGREYLVDANLPYLHDVTHVGQARIVNGSDTFYINKKKSQENKIYVSTMGSPSDDGLTPYNPVSDLFVAIDIIDNYVGSDKGWIIELAAGTYNHTHMFAFDGRELKIRGPNPRDKAIFDFSATPYNIHGFRLYRSKVSLENITITGATYAGMRVDCDSKLTADNCSFSNNKTMGVDCNINSDLDLTNCTFAGNTQHGVFVSQNSRVRLRGFEANNNGDKGIYINYQCGCYAKEGNVNGAQECVYVSGASTAYFQNVQANYGVVAGFLISGASIVSCNSCNTFECDRGYHAEYSSSLTLNTCEADGGTTQKTNYPAYFAQYGSQISFVTIDDHELKSSKYSTVMKAEANSIITANRPTRFDATDYTTFADPTLNTRGNRNSYIAMDDPSGDTIEEESSYTPSLVDVSNGGSPTATIAQYRKNSTTVEVFGQISRGSISSGMTSKIRIGLPIPSNLIAAYDLIGEAISTSGNVQQRAIIYGDVTNDQALFVQDAATTLSSAAFLLYHFRYKIK
ncbi:MAG: right-handed parallel beta-helix repeat-containing protein [Myxococcota bacterium]|nr:right-handed parallel beta-helix repeat-containing protein [Myxococcota bacterium]